MRQRVGFARALVMDPDVLLMDEAFSALDVLTGETLRDDMLELWEERRIADQGHPRRLAQHRRGGVHGRPGADLLQRPGAGARRGARAGWSTRVIRMRRRSGKSSMKCMD